MPGFLTSPVVNAFTPTGTIQAQTVQGAIAELDGDIQTLDSVKIEIPVYADEAARDAAITSPTQSQIVFITGLNTFQYWNGTIWAALGAGGGLPVDFLLVGA